MGNAFATLKALSRETAARAARIVDALWTATGHPVDRFTTAECSNDFAAAGENTT